MRCQLIILVLSSILAACSAESPSRRRLLQQQRRHPVQRFQRLRQPTFGARTHFLAQQQATPVTPYPAAEDLRPAVSFAPQPELTYGPPDQIYGPPAEQLPKTALPEEFDRNPEAEEIEIQPKPARLISRLQRLQQPQQQLAKLQIQQSPVLQPILQRQHIVQPIQSLRPIQTVAALNAAAPVSSPVPTTIAAPLAPLAALPVAPQQFYVINQPFAYTAQY